MKWKLTFVEPPDDVRPLQTLPLQTKSLSGWQKVQEWVRDHPKAVGKVYERVNKRPRSLRRAIERHGKLDTDGFQLFCSFADGRFS